MKSRKEAKHPGIKLVIFDFDGTIVDTKKLYYFAILKELKKAGYHSGKAEKKLIANIGMRLPEFLGDIGVKKKDIARMKNAINSHVIKNSKNIKRCPQAGSIKNVKNQLSRTGGMNLPHSAWFLSMLGIPRAIQTTRPRRVEFRHLKKCCHVIVISNSVSSFIRKIAKRLKIEGYFSRIIGGESFVDKAKKFRSLFKEYGIKPHEAVYVGDRAYDAVVARKAGCKSIIISNRCSWNPLQDILKARPDYVVSSLAKIKSILS